MEKARQFSNTNWNLYRCFIVLYETGKYTESEKVLLMERKNIRTNIQTLENQLNHKLFNSHTRGVTPTSTAKTLYPFIKKAVESIIDGEDNIKTLKEDSVALIKIAMPPTVSNIDSKSYFIEFCEKHKNVRLQFQNKSSKV